MLIILIFYSKKCNVDFCKKTSENVYIHKIMLN
nr:MAG TPA: hypothetical protein [Caudoviricetes sp.]